MYIKHRQDTLGSLCVRNMQNNITALSTSDYYLLAYKRCFSHSLHKPAIVINVIIPLALIARLFSGKTFRVIHYRRLTSANTVATCLHHTRVLTRTLPIQAERATSRCLENDTVLQTSAVCLTLLVPELSCRTKAWLLSLEAKEIAAIFPLPGFD